MKGTCQIEGCGKESQVENVLTGACKAHTFTNYQPDWENTNGSAGDYTGSEKAVCDGDGCQATRSRFVSSVTDLLNILTCQHTWYEFDLSQFNARTGSSVGSAFEAPILRTDMDSDADQVLVLKPTEGTEKFSKLRMDLAYDSSTKTVINTNYVADGKYHLYVSKNVAIDQTGYTGIYLFDAWNPTCGSYFNAKLQELFAGKTVDFYVSMKVETDDNGANTYYIDRIFVVNSSAITWVANDDGTCTTVNTKTHTCPTCSTPYQVPDKNGAFKHTFTSYTPDVGYTPGIGGSYVGSEIATCDKCNNATGTRDVKTVLDYMQCDHSVYKFDLTTFHNRTNNDSTVTVSYGTDPDSSEQTVLVMEPTAGAEKFTGLRLALQHADGTDNIFVIQAKDVIKDGKYHLYLREDVAINRSAYTAAYLFDGWNPVCGNEYSAELLERFGGKTVDFYVSLKVDTSAGAEVTPTYYIDKIVVVDKDAWQTVDSTCVAGGKKVFTCTQTGCGKISEMPNADNPIDADKHSFTTYVPQGDGTEVATCDHCKVATRTRTEDLNLAHMQIALPATPTVVEQTAAKELADYVEKITGTRPNVVSESQVTGEAVYIGNTQFAEDKAITPTEVNEFGEGWIIKAVDRNLVLNGQEIRGVLYAVYHLLEDVLGVRWWNLWEEYVPSSETAMVPKATDMDGVPAMDYREIIIGKENAATNFFVRNRVNGFTSNGTTEFGGEENFGSPSYVHSFGHYFPPYDKDSEFYDLVNAEEDYFKKYPEWFALKDGKRIDNGQLCLTNASLLEAFKGKLIKSIEYSYEKADAAGRARPRYFALSPNDRYGHCECEACQQSYEAYGISGTLLNFVNALADYVKNYEAGGQKPYADITFVTLAYWDYVQPPKGGVKPADNVVIQFADIYMDLLHDINDPNNKSILDGLKAWNSICGENNLHIWDYETIYARNGVLG